MQSETPEHLKVFGHMGDMAKVERESEKIGEAKHPSLVPSGVTHQF